MTLIDFVKRHPEEWIFASKLMALYAYSHDEEITLRSASEMTGIPETSLRRKLNSPFWFSHGANLAQTWRKLGASKKIAIICESVFCVDENFSLGANLAQTWRKLGANLAQNGDNSSDFETISNTQNELDACKSQCYIDFNDEEAQSIASITESSVENSKKRKEPKEKNIIDNIVENNNNINNNIKKTRLLLSSDNKLSSENNNASEKSSQASPAPKEGTKKVKDKLTLPPPMKDVTDYFTEQGHPEMAEQFYDFYESVGWMVGKNRMKDLKATIRNWIRRSDNFPRPSLNTKNLSVVSPVPMVSNSAARNLEADAELMMKVDASMMKINPNAITPNTRHFLACMIDRFPYTFTKGVPITEKTARFYADKVSEKSLIEVFQQIETDKPEFTNLGLFLHNKLGS